MCDNCNKPEEYRKVFKTHGFWTFNKEIKCCNVFDPDWCKKNRVFELIPCKFYKKEQINKSNVKELYIFKS